MNSLFESFTSKFICQPEKIHKHQLLAIKNLISVAKERIWIADRLDATEYDSINFNENLSPDEVQVIKQSIKVLEKLVTKTEVN